MSFFTPDTFQFLKELDQNNSKEWFDANRTRYEAHWKTPAFEVIDAVAPALLALDPPLKAEARINGSLRRINRDVRFSKDKSPYNASLHLIFWAGGHPNRSAGTHIVLHPNGVGFGAGMWGFQGDLLSKYRARIQDTGDCAALSLALKEAKKVGCDMDKPDLARVPRGFEANGQAATLLRYKSVVARTIETEEEPDLWCGEAGVHRIIEVSKALSPLNKWLDQM